MKNELLISHLLALVSELRDGPEAKVWDREDKAILVELFEGKPDREYTSVGRDVMIHIVIPEPPPPPPPVLRCATCNDLKHTVRHRITQCCEHHPLPCDRCGVDHMVSYHHAFKEPDRG